MEEEQRVKVELLRTELKVINESLSKNKDSDITIDEVVTKSLPNITFLVISFICSMIGKLSNVYLSICKPLK
ncbi:hypothetical protein KGF51_18430 [Clostridioides sp. ZZV14-6045]|uniref:hypothetical protein n=1 Tax=unclassified Clostridioides TaxID=2635829 RepID=UPI001D12D3FA|nr:hypothetical protein [Clostridioides sp. ZZV14-6045]MCC0729810.1 hypothetical protein [Clostridioides sp. ZZV14-6048]